MARGVFQGWHIVILLLFLAAFALWVWGLIDAAMRPNERWQAVGHSKALFLALIIVLGWFGALLYALIPRPAMVRRERQTSAAA